MILAFYLRFYRKHFYEGSFFSAFGMATISSKKFVAKIIGTSYGEKIIKTIQTGLIASEKLNRPKKHRHWKFSNLYLVPEKIARCLNKNILYCNSANHFWEHISLIGFAHVSYIFFHKNSNLLKSHGLTEQKKFNKSHYMWYQMIK